MSKHLTYTDAIVKFEESEEGEVYPTQPLKDILEHTEKELSDVMRPEA